MWNVLDLMVCRLCCECFFLTRSNTSPLTCSPFWVKTTFPTLKTVGAPFFSVIRRLTLIISCNSSPNSIHSITPSAHSQIPNICSETYSATSRRLKCLGAPLTTRVSSNSSIGGQGAKSDRFFCLLKSINIVNF